MPELTEPEKTFLNTARKVHKEGELPLDCKTPKKAISARHQTYTLKKRLTKRALDFPEECPSDTLEILANLSTYLPKGSSILYLSSGSWFDRIISNALAESDGRDKENPAA